MTDLSYLTTEANAISTSSSKIRLFAHDVAKELAALEKRLAVLEGASKPSPTPSPTPAPTPPGLVLPKQGFSNSWAILGRTSALQDRELDACKDLANGKPSFLRLDYWVGDTRFDTVKTKAEARGLTVMALVNADYSNRPSITQYAANCASAAKKCLYVNTCNEPDMGGGVAANVWPATEIADYLVAANAAVKQANPNAVVIWGSLNKTLSQNPLDGVAYAHAMLDRAGGKSMGDVFAFHPYADPRDVGPWNLWMQTAVLRNLLASYGFTGPMIATESGWPAADGALGKTGEKYQADTVANALDDGRTTFGLASVLVFSVPDDSSPGGYGLKDPAWTSRPAYAAFKSRAL